MEMTVMKAAAATTKLRTFVGVAMVTAALAWQGASADTVLFNDNAVEIAKTLEDPNDLWVSSGDLAKINGFEVKPEGICLADICIPIAKDSNLTVTRDGAQWINVTELARKLGQAHAVDRETKTWSFGAVPASRTPFLKSAVAPDFELKDRQGKTVRLSDYRGKKVLLVTWASWCGCRMDVPKWEPLYQKLKDSNLELISVAEDTAGEAAAGPIFDKAKVSFTTIVDPDHKISSLFSFVNVPSAAWIDEEGRVVRINEGTYAAKHKMGTFEFGSEDYLPAVEDWVKNGANSKYAWSPEHVSKKIRPQTSEEAQAEALFKLGVYFYKQGDLKKAGRYWDEAAALYPDSWNINRQDWAITDAKAQITNWLKKVRASTKPYYEPLDLEK
jgi:peroxiredoxin